MQQIELKQKYLTTGKAKSVRSKSAGNSTKHSNRHKATDAVRKEQAARRRKRVLVLTVSGKRVFQDA